MNPDGRAARTAWRSLVFALKPLLWAKHAEIVNREVLVDAGAVIITCNHPSLLDSLWIILLSKRRVAICGAKPKYFSTRAKRTLLGIANIRRVSDYNEFMSSTKTILERGEPVLVYPEMGRNPDGLGHFETWAAELALEVARPVLPCWIHGTAPTERGRPRLIVGSLMQPSGSPEHFTSSLRAAMLQLADS